MIFNWSLLVSSKKPSDVERAFVSDTAQHLADTVEEKLLSTPKPTEDEKNSVDGITNLHEALDKIQELEKRLRDIEYRIPKKYPEVEFLTYKDRKRILVSVKLLLLCTEQDGIFVN